jgi:tetratricopeptide (TPR) repeat protein
MRSLLVLAVLAASVAGAVTDADRVQVYHEFRTAFDAKRYDEALPLAKQLVTLTEQQYGTTDRALMSPLSNLGTTQYRLRDFKAAEDTYLRAVKVFEDTGGGMDRVEERVLHGLGAAYYATGQFEDASVVLQRAVDLCRALDGLFNVEQISILDRLIDSLAALDRHEETERAYDYSIRVAETAYGKADLRVMRPLDRSAHWQERMGRYATARILYARALQIAEQAADTARTVEPLEGIARTYRLEFVNADPVVDSEASAADPLAPPPEPDPTVANSQRLNPDGEHAIMLALRAINKTQPLDHVRRGTALVELGDWYLSGGMLPQGLEAYRAAWRDFAQSGSTTTPLGAPRQLAYRPPMASVVRMKEDRDNLDEHYVEATFTVTKDGHTADVQASDSDASESQQKAVLSALRRARYAPRLEQGEPVDTEGVRFRERMLVKKPRPN